MTTISSGVDWLGFLLLVRRCLRQGKSDAVVVGLGSGVDITLGGGNAGTPQPTLDKEWGTFAIPFNSIPRSTGILNRYPALNAINHHP
jgi:hypothetical protein